jgi:hypothetical protein
MRTFQPSKKDLWIAWAAGIFEGEGSVGVYGRERHRGDKQPRMTINNTDLGGNMKRIIIAVLATMLVMSGSAYAANRYVITSTKQIKPSVLTKLKGNTGKTGPQGAQGPQGASGATGAQGPQGIPGAGIEGITVRHVTQTTSTGGPYTITATCLPGERALSGNAVGQVDEDLFTQMAIPVPNTGTPTGWKTVYRQDISSVTTTVYVVCAKLQ